MVLSEQMTSAISQSKDIIIVLVFFLIITSFDFLPSWITEFQKLFLVIGVFFVGISFLRSNMEGKI